ncbi:MAG: hypothetical protein FJ038_06225, partial [Chloroflexi bacterium]|nr:hypothetical protein [Chloroflexota bacterium]
MPPESAPSTLSPRLPVVAFFALVLVAGALPGAALGVDPAASEERPSVHYEQALAHAGDKIAFTPGARVVTGFTSKVRTLATKGGAVTRQVIGFLPYWELTSAKLTLRYDLLSTIAYFGVGADTAGNLQKQNADGSLTTGWAGWTSNRMTSIIEAAHAAGTRVVLTITVFAWTTSDRNRQAALLGSPSARANLARQLADAVRDRGADGVNVDFEPIASGYGDEFTDFVRLLRAEFDAIA